MERAKMLMRIEPHQEKNIFKLFIYDSVTKEGTIDWSEWRVIDSKTSAQYFADQLAQIPDNAEIELYINSNGGSVPEGVSIYNQLKRHPAQKTGYVDGIAYSVASLILQACDRRVMGLGTSMLVHEMWISIDGNAEMLRKAADDLDNWMNANRKVYLERCSSKMTEEELLSLMKEERILTPEECLEYGFIDEINEKAGQEGDTEEEPEEEPEEPEEPDADDTEEPEVNTEQIQQLKSMSQYIKTRNALIKSIKQLNDTEERRTGPQNCAAFFNRFFN